MLEDSTATLPPERRARVEERTAGLIAEVKTAVLNQFANRAERWRKLIQLTTFDARLPRAVVRAFAGFRSCPASARRWL